MRRRLFLSSGLAVTTGYGYSSLMDSWSTDIDYLDSLIHKNNLEPATIVPDSDSGFIVSVPDKIDGDCIIVTENKYASPRDWIQIYKIPIEDGVYYLDEPKSENIYAYTMYAKYDDNNYEYIGESLPLYWNGTQVVEKESYLDLPPRELGNKRRSVEIGYYEISGFQTPKVRVSQQLRASCSQENSYKNAQDRVQNSPFCEYVANRVLSDIDRTNISRSLRELTDFVQNTSWVKDTKSSGYFNYIRNPVATVANGFGDCEDTTLLLNGLIESYLGIRTALIFSHNHISSAINKEDTLDKSDDLDFSDTKSYTHSTGEYIPIETTSSLPIGDLPRDPFLVYRDDRYRILDINGVVKHFLPIF